MQIMKDGHKMKTKENKLTNWNKGRRKCMLLNFPSSFESINCLPKVGIQTIHSKLFVQIFYCDIMFFGSLCSLKTQLWQSFNQLTADQMGVSRYSYHSTDNKILDDIWQNQCLISTEWYVKCLRSSLVSKEFPTLVVLSLCDASNSILTKPYHYPIDL